MKLLELIGWTVVLTLVAAGCVATSEDLRALDAKWSAQGYATVGDLTEKAEELDARVAAVASTALSTAEVGGIGGLLSVAGMVGLNMYRNATRKKTVQEIKNDPAVSNQALETKARMAELEAKAKASSPAS